MKVYLHMYSRNVQQNPLCPASCVTKDLPISPRFPPTIFCRDARSVLLRTHLCTAVLIGSMRRTLSSKLFIGERQGLSTHVQWECSAGPSMRNILCHKKCSHLSPVPACDFLSPGKFSTLQCTVFYTLQAKLMHPADKNLTNLAIKNVFVVLHSTAASLTTEHEGISTCTTRMHTGYSNRRYFQHAHFIPIVGVGKRGEY